MQIRVESRTVRSGRDDATGHVYLVVAGTPGLIEALEPSSVVVEFCTVVVRWLAVLEYGRDGQSRVIEGWCDHYVNPAELVYLGVEPDGVT